MESREWVIKEVLPLLSSDEDKERLLEIVNAMKFFKRHYRSVEELVGGIKFRSEPGALKSIGLRKRVEEYALSRK
jgi:hypothetical protein